MSNYVQGVAKIIKTKGDVIAVVAGDKGDSK
jgi:hypothetical protein